MLVRICFLLITLWASCDLQAWGGFKPQVTYAVGSNPVAAALADFNHDTFKDIAVVNQGSNTISILLNNGDGTFTLAHTYSVPVGALPISIVAADFNGDNIPDLAVLNSGNLTVSIFIGNGDGSFQPPSTFSVGSAPTLLASGDFTGDGRQDLVVSYAGLSNTVELFIGNGDGTFTPDGFFSVGANPSCIAVADVNGDGNLDLAVTNASASTVSVLLGDGHGNFLAQQTFAVGNAPASVAVGRLTSTDFPDLVVANSADSTVSTLIGNGDGTFQSQATHAVGLTPVSVALADITSSGNLDIVTANNVSNTVTVLTNSAAYNTQNTFTVGNAPSYIVLGDLNNDGLPDAVVTNSADNTISVLINTFQQTITFPPIPDKVYSTPPFAISATSSSGLPVFFSILSGPATISGNIITITGTGTVVVAANQPGQNQIGPAPQVTQSFVVEPNFIGQVIHNRFLTQTDIIYRLSWVPSPDPNVTQFALYKNGMLIQVTPASGPFKFEEHNKKKGVVETFTLIALNAAGTALYVSTVTLGDR